VSFAGEATTVDVKIKPEFQRFIEDEVRSGR